MEGGETGRAFTSRSWGHRKNAGDTGKVGDTGKLVTVKERSPLFYLFHSQSFFYPCPYNHLRIRRWPCNDCASVAVYAMSVPVKRDARHTLLPRLNLNRRGVPWGNRARVWVIEI